MTKFREHNGSLSKSMATCVPCTSMDELKIIVQKILKPYLFKYDMEGLSLELYWDYPDDRIGWEKTYLVYLQGYGVVGFTDGL
jgi:hypothetical protein